MKTLEIRDRGITGTDAPLAAEPTFLMSSESIDICVPFGNVLPDGWYVSTVNWRIKAGNGVWASQTVIGVNQTDVLAKLSMGADAGVNHVLGAQATLSSGEVWEINVPVVRLDPL